MLSLVRSLGPLPGCFFFFFFGSSGCPIPGCMIKGSLEDTSELRRVEERCDWKGEGSRGDVN